MNKNFLWALAPLAIFLSMADAKAQTTPVSDQLEQCGAFVRIAPFCGESLEVDTRQLQAVQIVSVSLTPRALTEWTKIHQEKKRGIAYTAINDKGEKVSAGRPVINAVVRVIAIPASGNSDEAMLFQGLVSPDLSSVLVLLPAEGNFSGWNIYILSSEGKHALTLAGEFVELGGRHRTDGNLTLDIARLPASRIASTQLVQRGDGSGTVEALEATFLDHKLVRDRDGSTRVYSGLAGTFTPISDDGTSVVAMFSNCRTMGQRLVERANLRADSATIAAAPATFGLSLAPQIYSIGKAIIHRSCR